MNYQTWEEKTYNLSVKDFTNELLKNNFLKRLHECISCNCHYNLVKYTRNKDKLTWRYMNSSCDQYKKYISVRNGFFFENYNTDIQLLFRIVIKYDSGISRANLLQSFEGLETYIEKIVQSIKNKILIPDFSNSKPGTSGFIVQVDETMMNFKIKGIRSKSPTNRTDALCIVEVGLGIIKVFANSISD